LIEEHKIVYIGKTNDSKRREQEHKDDGKKFSKMKLEFPCSAEVATKREQEEIKKYQKSHKGKKPKYND